MGQAGKAILLNGDAHHGIESEDREIGEIVSRQSLIAEMGLEATQASESAPPRAQSTPVRQFRAAVVAHHDVLNIATPIDQYAHLAADVVADLGQIARQLVGQKPVRLEPSLKEPLKLLHLTGLEASGVSVDLDGKMLQQPEKAALGRCGARRGASPTAGR